MTRLLASFALLALLASCGADGAPTAPPTKQGLSITGQAKVGIAGGN